MVKEILEKLGTLTPDMEAIFRRHRPERTEWKVQSFLNPARVSAARQFYRPELLAGYEAPFSNFAPQVTLRFHTAVLAGDTVTQRQILSRVIEPICRVRDLRRGYAVSYVKAAVDLLGLLGPEGPVCPPLTDLTPEHRELLRAVLEELFRHYPAD